jgi:predicted DsbA family dithiol-disulfide isomerase
MMKYSPRDLALLVLGGRLRTLAIAGASTLLMTGCGPTGLESTGTATETSPAATGDPAIALVLEGRPISLDELHTHMQEQFLEELLNQPDDEIYTLHENAIRDLVHRHAIDAAAAEAGLSPEALFEQVTAAVPETSVEEVSAWYSANQARLRGARLEDVAGRIQDMLDSEARSNAWAGFVNPRLEALDWEMVIEPPRKDLQSTRLVRGDVDAPITIMSFSDYQCPYCIRSEPVLAEVLNRYPGEVRLIHRHFPLDSLHPLARPASEAAMCADEQGHFWEFHDAIFARQGRLDENAFAEIGEALGLDGEALDQCITERRYQTFVQSDFDEGQLAGVTGTPAFFVNGIPLKGARDADELSRIVDAELARIAPQKP